MKKSTAMIPLTGKALRDKAARLNIPGRSTMTAGALRTAIAAAQRSAPASPGPTKGPAHRPLPAEALIGIGGNARDRRRERRRRARIIASGRPWKTRR